MTEETRKKIRDKSQITSTEEAIQFLVDFSPNEYFNENWGFGVDDSTFCIIPWIHTSTTTNGEFRLCCRSKRVWDIHHVSLKELWNHRKYKEIRKNLINGVKDSHCSACWKMEEKGIISLRQTHNFERVEEYGHLVDYSGEASWNIPIVEFKLSNLCNLKCRMCWPKDSTPWIQDWEAVKHIYDETESSYVNGIIDKNNLYKKPVMNLFESNEKFVEEIESLLPKIKEFEFAGGEPLMDPLHYKMLEKIEHPEEVILKYSTNLTDLEAKKGRNIVDLWKKFKLIRLTISIDGPPELNSYIRHGADWAKIVENVRYVKEQLGDKLDYIKASTTISALNVEFLPETLDAVLADLKIEWHTSRLQWPNFLHANVLPIERLIAQRERLEDKFKEIGIRLNYQHGKVVAQRHISDSISWINECIDKNMHSELYHKYLEFNKILDERRNENYEDIINGILRL